MHLKLCNMRKKKKTHPDISISVRVRRQGQKPTQRVTYGKINQQCTSTISSVNRCCVFDKKDPFSDSTGVSRKEKEKKKKIKPGLQELNIDPFVI